MFSYTNLDVRLIHLYNHYLHHKSYSTEYIVHLSTKSHTRRNNVLHPLEMKCLKTFGFISNMSRHHPFNSIDQIQYNFIHIIFGDDMCTFYNFLLVKICALIFSMSQVAVTQGNFSCNPQRKFG